MTLKGRDSHMAFDLGSAVGYLLLDSSGFQSGLDSANAGLKTFTDKSASTADKLSGLGSAMSTIGGNMTKMITLPVLGAGAAVLSLGNDFEAQMSRVKAISGATGDELEQLNDLALQLGADTSFSASEAASGMENLASAGFTVNEIMGAMPGLLDLAASSGADLATASEIAANTIRGFGLEADEAAHVADVFAEAAARTNAQTEDMGEAMKYIAPVANAMGQSLEQTAAAIGIMSDAGIKGGQAGTSLRGALSRLAKPTDVMYDKMEELGLSFYDTEDNMLSLVGIVEQLEDKMGGLTQEQRNNALVTLFGQESLSGMLALMERGSGELDALAKSFEEADGAAAEMADTMMDNTSGAIEEMMGSLETLAILVQQIIAPYVKQAAEKITELINRFAELDESTQEMIVKFVAFAAAIGPVMLVLGKILGPISSIVKLVSGSGGVVAAVGKLGAAFTALTGPVALVIAAVAALVAAWATNFGGIRDATASIFESLKIIVSSALDFIKGLWDSNLLGIQDLLSMWWENFELYWGMIFDTIAGIFEVFALAFQGDWEGVWNKLGEIVSNIVETVKTMFMNFLNTIVDTVIIWGVRLWYGAQEAFSNIGKAVQEIWEEFMAWWEEVLQDPIGALTDLGQAMFDAGANLFSMLWDGLKSIWDGIVSWVNDCVNWIVSKVQFWKSESDKVNKDEPRGTGRSDGSHSSGLDYVPYNGYVAEVHEGEAILTKEEADAYRRGKDGGGDTFIFNSPEPISEIEAARQVRRVKREIAEDIL